MQVYRKSKSAIIGIITELKIVSTHEFEKFVICGDEKAFQ